MFFFSFFFFFCYDALKEDRFIIQIIDSLGIVLHTQICSSQFVMNSVGRSGFRTHVSTLQSIKRNQ